MLAYKFSDHNIITAVKLTPTEFKCVGSNEAIISAAADLELQLLQYVTHPSLQQQFSFCNWKINAAHTGTYSDSKSMNPTEV